MDNIHEDDLPLTHGGDGYKDISDYVELDAEDAVINITATNTRTNDRNTNSTITNKPFTNNNNNNNPGVTFYPPINLPPAHAMPIVPPPPQIPPPANIPLMANPAIHIPPPPPQTADLAAAALALEQRVCYSMTPEIERQSTVQGDAGKIKTFWSEVLHSCDLVVFAYMRPGTVIVQLLHLASTFSLHGGDADLW